MYSESVKVRCLIVEVSEARIQAGLPGLTSHPPPYQSPQSPMHAVWTRFTCVHFSNVQLACATYHILSDNVLS